MLDYIEPNLMETPSVNLELKHGNGQTGIFSSLYCHVVWSNYRLGFGLNIGYIDHFSTQLVITLNYSTISYFHTLQVSRAHTISLATCSVFTSSCMVTASNNGYSSASGLKFSLNDRSVPNEYFSSHTSVQN
jgi:hypothetical protein